MSLSHAFRALFSSLAGGVGRSAAVCAAAWGLAKEGKRALVVDLNFRSPELSRSLLSDMATPVWGIADWLTDDRASVRAADVVAEISVLEKRFLLAPACGTHDGNYMKNLQNISRRNDVVSRLKGLLSYWEDRFEVDVTLVDAPAGLDGFSLSCMTELGADELFLFISDKTGMRHNYDMLFRYWRETGALYDIREKMQLVASILPREGTAEYYRTLCENAWNLFLEHVYDEIPAGASEEGRFSFDWADCDAPHYPLPVRPHEGLVHVESFLSWIRRSPDDEPVRHAFGSIVNELKMRLEGTDVSDIHVGNIGETAHEGLGEE